MKVTLFIIMTNNVQLTIPQNNTIDCYRTGTDLVEQYKDQFKSVKCEFIIKSEK